MNTLTDITTLAADAGWHHDGAGWWIIFPVLWAAVLATVVWLVIRTTRRREPSGTERARDILAERYARGEISLEEYRERRNELG
jgi:putative membrane protein